MIRVQVDGEERRIGYEEFIRAIQAGEITAETPVWSEALTAGVWKQAGDLRFFRAWAPKGAIPETESATPADPEPQPPEEPDDESLEDLDSISNESAEALSGKPGTTLKADADLDPTDTGPADDDEGSGLDPDDDLGDTEMPMEEPVPWEQIDRVGVPAGLYGTIWLALREPRLLFQRVSTGTNAAPAIAFGLLIFAVASIVDGAYGALMISWFGDRLREVYSALPGLFGEEGIPSSRQVFFGQGMRILFYPIGILIWSGLIHLFVRSFGQPMQGFAGTFRVVNYAMAPLVLSILPFCGNVVGGIWTLVLVVLGIVWVQRASVLVSILAVAIPLLLFFCLWSSSLFGPMMQALPNLGSAV